MTTNVSLRNIFFILAKDTFQAVGHKLISRRKHDDHDVMLSYIPEDEHDPANNDPELKRNLEESSKIAETKLNKVFDLSYELSISFIISMLGSMIPGITQYTAYSIYLAHE